MTDPSPPNVVVRQGTADDVGFLFNSLLKSYRDAPAVRGVPNDIYYKAHHAVIERILQRPCCTCLMAVDSEDPRVIYGYCLAEYVGDGLCLHYLYVKYSCRGMGLARKLVESLMLSTVKAVTYSHRTRVVDNMSSKLEDNNWTFNPYLQY